MEKKRIDLKPGDLVKVVSDGWTCITEKTVLHGKTGDVGLVLTKSPNNDFRIFRILFDTQIVEFNNIGAGHHLEKIC